MLAGSTSCHLAQPCHQSTHSSSQPAQLPREHRGIAGQKDTAQSCPLGSPTGAWGQGLGHRSCRDTGRQVVGHRVWDTGVQGHGAGRNWGTNGGHKGLGTESETQVQRQGKWDTGTWQCRDTGASGNRGMGHTCRDARVQGLVLQHHRFIHTSLLISQSVPG